MSCEFAGVVTLGKLITAHQSGQGTKCLLPIISPPRPHHCAHIMMTMTQGAKAQRGGGKNMKKLFKQEVSHFVE